MFKFVQKLMDRTSCGNAAKPFVRRRLRFTFSLYKGHVAQYRWKVWGYQKPKYWEGVWYYAFGVGFGVIGWELE